MANMNFGVNILPKENNTYTLGNSDKKWNLFTNNINGTSVSNLFLPTVTSSNNGQILKVDNGVWTVGTAPTSLPTVTSSDNGKILKVDNGTWAVANLSTMTGATASVAGSTGLVPAPTTGDVNKFLAGDGTYKSGGLPMVILSYGSSTWNDFINAYNNNVIVYCRASSNSNPASGSQTRMAFMAYVSDASNPTSVEFQYYRSMSAHSSTAMGDEVYVYKLTNASGGTWSVTTRKASIKEIAVASGSKLGVSWSSDKVTLSNTMTAADMAMSSSDATTTKAMIEDLASRISVSWVGNTDLNTLRKTGLYMISQSNSNTPTDIGDVDWASLLVITNSTANGASGGDTGVQVFFGRNGIAVRNMFSANWGSWRRIYSG